ncbi:hypothetical protein VIGAN_09206700 [Vigna angularis var. angularis]|uniref:Uncharacterized protein n=1 Tax=Vigna angularis var. angularis TaxID=157739 RepID=A0A0S3SZU7_PHAAN|nr:hypothetical protein VIGAN_09206700 [Vigna angularis var. angularis]
MCCNNSDPKPKLEIAAEEDEQLQQLISKATELFIREEWNASIEAYSHSIRWSTPPSTPPASPSLPSTSHTISSPTSASTTTFPSPGSFSRKPWPSKSSLPCSPFPSSPLASSPHRHCHRHLHPAAYALYIDLLNRHAFSLSSNIHFPNPPTNLTFPNFAHTKYLTPE